MSIDSLLKELVSTIKGATGAILLEADGEAVGYYSPNADRLRLRGAYAALVLKSCRTAAVRAKLGGVSCLALEYAGAAFVARELNRDCFVLLELNPTVNLGEALFRIKPLVEKLRYEIER